MFKVPNSFIKGVAFELPEDFKFDHAPWTNKNDPFVGREIEEKKFLSMLKNSKDERGVYMVTGYRGMGKTSFVNKVLNEYKNYVEKKSKLFRRKKVKIINVHIATNYTNDLEILRHITGQLRDTIYQQYQGRKYGKKLLRLLQILSGCTTVCSLVLLLYPILDYQISTMVLDTYEETITHKLIELELSLGILSGLMFLMSTFLLRFINSYHGHPFNVVDDLFKRAYATITTEQNHGVDIPLSNSIIDKISVFNKKETNTYPIASSKEMEEALIGVLGKIKHKIDIIFVFDELDKVKLQVTNEDIYADHEQFSKDRKNQFEIDPDENRHRKAIIINILGNLKSFFTRADARFIFIAGREMFDAALADVSDRQSLLSSIFNHIFYLDSFLKERSSSPEYKYDHGITDMIEEYIITTITGNKSNIRDLKGLFNNNGFGDSFINIPTAELPDAQRKAIFMLQKLIVYLTYRSNGSPKKLQKALQSFITVRSYSEINAEKIIVVANKRRYWDLRSNILALTREQQNASVIDSKRIEQQIIDLEQISRTENRPDVPFLYINYDNQYRIGFINYLFRPYIINKSTYLTSLSDNTLVTTPYIMDHLIKFHPFAFSQNNLEQIPEVISANSTQALREYITSLVHYFSLNHIRETHVNLFSYKFISKSENELNYLTLKHEEESAAFNFTLDESYNIKLHLRRKIKERRSFLINGVQTDIKQVYSISFLNGRLGDTHFFDQEYDEAITHYSDSIKDISNLKFRELNFRDFALMINTKLKIGLCLEKIKSFDDAISFYTDAINNAKTFIYYVINSNQDTSTNNLNRDNEDVIVYPTSVITDLLQVVNQSFIAKAYVQEKMSFSGFFIPKAKHNLLSFEKICINVYKSVQSNNYLTMANYFLNMGNLAYYKNQKCTLENIGNIFNERISIDFNNIQTYLEKFAEYKNNNDKKYSLALAYYLAALVSINRYYLFDDNFEKEKVACYEKYKYTKRAKKSKQYYETENDIHSLIESVNNESKENATRYARKLLATLYSFIGNCLIENYHGKNSADYNRKNLYTNLLRGILQYKLSEVINGYSIRHINNNIQWVLYFYQKSADYFTKTGTKVSVSFQLRKILFLIRAMITTSDENITYHPNTEEILRVLKYYIIKRLYSVNSEISDTADKKQYLKYLKTFGRLNDINLSNPDDIKLKKHIDDSLSNHAEDREVWLLYKHIHITLKGSVEPKDFDFVNQYNSIATQYGRIGELLYEEKRCWLQLKEFQNTMSDFTNLDTKTLNSTKDIIIDHLFACLSIIRISNILTLNRMVSDSLIGYIYFKVGWLIHIFLDPINECNKQLSEPFKESVISILNIHLKENPYVLADKNYYFKKAKLHFEKAISLHNQGKEYENLLNLAIYLEDTYNDNSNHFGLALERFFIKTDRIPSIIEKMNPHIEQDIHGLMH